MFHVSARRNERAGVTVLRRVDQHRKAQWTRKRGAAPGATPASRPGAKGVANGGWEVVPAGAAATARAGTGVRESGVAGFSTVTTGVPASGADMLAQEQTAWLSAVAQTLTDPQASEARAKARTRWTIAGRALIVCDDQATGGRVSSMGKVKTIRAELRTGLALPRRA